MADFFPSKYRAIVFSIYHYGVYVGMLDKPNSFLCRIQYVKV